MRRGSCVSTSSRNANAPECEDQPEIIRTEHLLNKGTVYLVSSPIGNPEDITLRAIGVLRTVRLIAAEDSRVIGPLLARLGISSEMCSLRPHAHGAVLQRIKSTLLSGEDVGIVCDAGTPLIADPGGRIVSTAIEMGCRVVPIPGAVAAIAAITISGLRTQRFAFDGFPPRSKSDRSRFFSILAAEERTIILYESRSYLPNTLQCLTNELGADRRITITRDLTRATETAFRGTLGEMAKQFSTSPPRGEYVLVIEGLTSE